MIECDPVLNCLFLKRSTTQNGQSKQVQPAFIWNDSPKILTLNQKASKATSASSSEFSGSDTPCIYFYISYLSSKLNDVRMCRRSWMYEWLLGDRMRHIFHEQ